MRTDSTRQFGVRVDGVTLLLPAGAELEYVASAPIYPLPGAGGRVIGLMQLRGYPIVVMDPCATQPRARGAIARRDVLVIGSGSDAGALCVEAPPVEIDPGDVVREAVRPQAAFGAALGDAFACASPGAAPRDDDNVPRGSAGEADRPAHWLCWRIEPRRLFELLSAD